jgi:hypothetical protein
MKMKVAADQAVQAFEREKNLRMLEKLKEMSASNVELIVKIDSNII